jgi:hypothetical protein
VGPPPSSPWSLNGDVSVLNPSDGDGVNDGIGYAAAVIGNTAYIGGSFFTITNGTTSYGRYNTAAFDITTGRPTTFTADTNGRVLAMATDGTKLFIGGTFTMVNGQPRDHFAAVDPTTGAVLGGAWVKNFSNNVYSLSASSSKVYVGGAFNNVGGTSRSRVAALSLADGSLDASFHPVVQGAGVDSIAAAPDDSRVYLGGGFTTIDGVTDAGTTRIAELDSAGVVQHPTVGFTGVDSGALDLEVAAGNDVISALGGDDNEVVRSQPGGARTWTTGDLCKGDAQAIHQIGGFTYGGFHQSCKDAAGNYDSTFHLVKMNSTTGAVDYSFKPTIDGYWGVYGLAGYGTALVAVGQFDHVNGAVHKGFVIFSPAP